MLDDTPETLHANGVFETVSFGNTYNKRFCRIPWTAAEYRPARKRVPGRKLDIENSL